MIKLSKAWKIASIATSIASLFFFTIFFFYMIYGYTIYLLEPVVPVAIAEFLLCLSALLFQIRSLKLPIFKYPLLLLAVLQYFDFISSYFAGQRGGHELNPFISIYTLLLKLIFFPVILILIQKYWFKYIIQWKLAIWFLIVVYSFVIISNFLGAIGL